MREKTIEKTIMEKIGIMGGSFNPIHLGHLHLAESARVEFHLDKVIFIPAGDNPFKQTNVSVTRQQRFEMVNMAIASNERFASASIELDRHGKSYTIDTIREIKKMYPQSELYFITGADIMFEITQWRSAEELLQSINFITATRPGYPVSKWRRRVRRLRKKYHANIYGLMSAEMDITSTEIRNRIASGQSIKYLIPEPVEAYIETHHLYQIKEDR